MFEETVSSIPSIWSSMNSWFTPTVLFVLLNLMIGTILFTSSLANQKHQQQNPDDPQQHPRLAKSPSVLQRLRSINLYSYRSQEPHPSPPIAAHLNPNPDSETPKTETHRVFPQPHFEEEEPPSLDEVYSQLRDHHVNRTKSDTKPASGEIPEKLPAKMRKSASAKSAFAHFEEDEIVEVRRPATVKEGKARVTEADDEVDAKADDFINRFKQQLKLQRLDSIIRYKDMIGRGVGK